MPTTTRNCPAAPQLGSTINVPAIDLRKLGDEEQNLLHPLALAPKGIWFAPKDLRLFYQVRQNWRGKAVLVKLIWRMFRARVFGDRMAAIGQSLAATDAAGSEGARHPAVAEHADDRVDHRCRRERSPARSSNATVASSASALGTASFWPRADSTTTCEWRRQHLPVLEKDWSFGNPASMGDGIRAGEKVGGSTDLLDEAWWFPAMCWPDGRLQFMLNERMMPSQFVVNGEGKRFINEAAPYMDFAHAMIEGQNSGVDHIPCWLVTDIRSFHRYVVGGHLPIPKVPFAPVPTGWKVPKAWLDSGIVVEGNSFEELATRIGVPPAQLRATADRFNELARKGHDDDFNRGDSRLRQLLRRPDAAQPQSASAAEAAVLRVPDHPRRPRHVGRAAHRRARACAALR